MEENCDHKGCENEATTKGFVLLRPENDGDAPNFYPVNACNDHNKQRGFFKDSNSGGVVIKGEAEKL